MGEKISKSKKLTFEEPVSFAERMEQAKEEIVAKAEEKIAEAQPKAEEPKAEEPKTEEPKAEPAPQESPVYTGPEPAGTNRIAQPLRDVRDILNAQISQRAQEYYDNAARQQYGVPQGTDLRSRIAEIIKPNLDDDGVKSLVHFDGVQPNYIVMDVQPIRLRQAWDLYRQYEKPVPGRFMEMVFEILNSSSRRYFHKISIVELR